MSEYNNVSGLPVGRKLSRRGMLKGIGGAVAGFALLGCSPGGSPAPAPTTPPAAAPTSAPAATVPTSNIKRGGTLRAALAFTFPTLDPHLTTSRYNPTMMMMFDGFMRHYLVDREKGVFESRPELAVSWERPEPTKFVMKLRQGVKFHDGTEFDAEAAKWNIDRWITHPQFYAKAYTGSMDSVDVLDKHTVRINLKAPQSSLEAILGLSTDPNFAVISPTAFEAMGEEAFGTKPVGTGPMKIVEWRRDDRLILERFDGYWDQGEDGKPLPYIDSLVERFIQDPSVTLAEMRSGNIDLTENIEAKDIAAVKNNPELTYWEIPWAGPHYFTMGISFKGGKLHDNLKLRQATLYAVDREAMARTFGFGVGKAHYYPYWGPGMLGYDESNPRYDFQPEKAKQLLTEAGFPNGVDITLSVITRAQELRIGEMVKSMWDKVGIRTTLESMERLAWIDKIRSGNFDIGFWRQGPSPDPDLASRGLITGAGANWPGASIPELDQAMAEGRIETDPAKRHEIYKRAQRVMYDNAYWGVGYFMPENKVYRKNVHGVSVTFQNLDTREVWLDK